MKRKREGVDDEGESVKTRRIQHKLKLGVTRIGHAFKIVKGFERQKLGRRQKNATEKGEEKDLERINSEIAALKALDTTASAKQHLYKSLSKFKEVAQHKNLPPEVAKPSKISSDAATLNVNARLCKAKQVQDALASTVDDIRQALGLDLDKPKPKKRRLRATDFDPGKAKDVDQSDDEALQGHSMADTITNNRTEANRNLKDSKNASRVKPSSNVSLEPADEDPDIAALEKQLASEGFEPRLPPQNSQPYNHEEDLSITESEADSRSPSPEPRKAPASTKSSFLPSLTMSGYVEGSGSEIDDEIDSAPRKNRRGQRARQQIWEKKYGVKAKHLQGGNRNKGWDPKRGAVEANGNRNSQRGRRGDNDVGGNGQQSNRRDNLPKKNQRKEDDGPIHPSWEAAKKAKERKEAPVAFQGKKITFD